MDAKGSRQGMHAGCMHSRKRDLPSKDRTSCKSEKAGPPLLPGLMAASI